MKNHHPKFIQNMSNNSQAVWINEAFFVICSCLYLKAVFNYGYYNQARFLQYLPTGHISAVKFVMGYEKNMIFLVILKSPGV